MYQSLVDEKKKKTDELAKKESDYSLLEQEINNLQNEDCQVKYIEERLSVHYAEIHDKYPVDKTQVPEIEETIAKKRDDMHYYIKRCDDECDSAARLWGYYSKNYDSECKKYHKECIYELKRIFGEVEVDLKRFYKRGISRFYLSKMVGIMSEICLIGDDYGKIPVSYQQKVYKWKKIEEELPIDEETESQEEKAEQKRLSNKNKTIKAEITRLQNKVNKLNGDLLGTDDLIELQKNELDQLICEKPAKVENIEENVRNRKDNLQSLFSKKEDEIRVKYHNQSIQKKELQERLEQLNKEYDAKSDEYSKTGIFAFTKRRQISDRIEEISSETKRIKIILINMKASGFESPEAEMETVLSIERKDFENKSRKLDKEASKSIISLDEEIEEKKEELKTLEEKRKKIAKAVEKESIALKNKTTEKNSINKQLKNFHSYYLINHYGNEMQFSQMISEREKGLKRLLDEIKKLKKEICAIDKALVKAEKEQSKKAKEAEKALKEKEKRQKRIQKELIDRQEELTVIEANPITLTSIPPIIKAIEAAKDHSYLKADRVPLADDGKRLITNSIVRKTYTQKMLVENCSQYILMFVDHLGNPISEQRLIPQNDIGEKTSTSFELKSDEGFDDQNYYLMMFNFDTGDIICATKYQINIAFANDFDF